MRFLQNCYSCYRTVTVAAELVQLLQNSYDCWRTDTVAAELLQPLQNCNGCCRTATVAAELLRLLKNWYGCWRTGTVAAELSQLLQNSYDCWRTDTVAAHLIRLLQNCHSCCRTLTIAEELIRLLQNCHNCCRTVTVAAELSQLLPNSYDFWRTDTVAAELLQLLFVSAITVPFELFPLAHNAPTIPKVPIARHSATSGERSGCSCSSPRPSGALYRIYFINKSDIWQRACPSLKHYSKHRYLYWGRPASHYKTPPGKRYHAEQSSGQSVPADMKRHATNSFWFRLGYETAACHSDVDCTEKFLLLCPGFLQYAQFSEHHAPCLLHYH